jgi:hypothetical protein
MKKIALIFLVLIIAGPMFADQKIDKEFFHGTWTEDRTIAVELSTDGGYATAHSLTDNYDRLHITIGPQEVQTNYLHGTYEVLWVRPSIYNRLRPECMLKVSIDGGLELWHISTIDEDTIMVCRRDREVVEPPDEFSFLSDSLLIDIYSR